MTDTDALADGLHELAAAIRVGREAAMDAWPLIRSKLASDPRLRHAIHNIESALGLRLPTESAFVVVGFAMATDGCGMACISLTTDPIRLTQSQFEDLTEAASAASVGDAARLDAWLAENDFVRRQCYRAGIRPSELDEQLRIAAEGYRWNCAKSG